MAPNIYLYSTNPLEIWYMIPESFSGIMYQISRWLDLNFLNYNQTRFQINERLYISNADRRSLCCKESTRPNAAILELWKVNSVVASQIPQEPHF